MSDDDQGGEATAPEGWVPDFPTQRPPFKPGNELTFKAGHTMSIQSGAYSPRRVDPLAQQLVAQVLDDPELGFLQARAYRPALWAWGRAEARCQLLDEYLGYGTAGDLEAKRVEAAYRELHKSETRAANLRSQLGLTPLARARLGKDVAQGRQADAAAELTRMREEHDRAERGGSNG